MRKLDVLTFGLAVLLFGGATYAALLVFGVDTQQSGIWAGGSLAVVLLAWTASYLWRFWTGTMSINEQTELYKTEAFKKRLETMTPEELAQFQADLEADGIELQEGDRPKA